jgi:hypothetical protein
MSKERELLQRLVTSGVLGGYSFIAEVKELLAQPEQEPVFNFDLARMKLALESPVSDVTAEELMKHVEGMLDTVEQETTECEKWYKLGHAQGLADSKREPLREDEMRAIWKEGIRGEIPFVEIGRAIEKVHGIGGGE